MLTVVDSLPNVEAVLARVDELTAGSRFVDAAEELARALRTDGPDVVLLRRLAHIERLLGHDQMALVLLGVAATVDGQDPQTLADQARTLVNLGCFRGAVAVLTDLPDPVRQDPAVRAALAATYGAMGLSELALDAFGDPRTLHPADRHARRRLWWRTGGPLRSLRRRRTEREPLRAWPPDPPASGADVPFARLGALLDDDRQEHAVLESAQVLIDDDEAAEAADLLSKAVATNGATAALLDRLSWAESLSGRQAAALAHLEEARRLDPGDLVIVENLAGLLANLGRFREALAVLTTLPQIRTDAGLRATLARVYIAIGLPALAADAYGDPRTLLGWQRRQRRVAWWRSGGPLRLLLWRPRRFERRVLRVWRRYSRHLGVLDALCWPTGFEPAGIRAGVDAVLLRGALLSERWWSIRWWVGRSAQAAGTALAWLGLFQVARLGAALPAWWAAVVASLGTLVAFAAYRVTFFRLANAGSWLGVLLRGGPTGLALIGAAYAVTLLPWPAAGWRDLVAVELAAIAGMALLYLLAMSPAGMLTYVRVHGHWRANPREDILDELLGLLYEVADPGTRNDLDRRVGWMSRLERAASTVEKRLSASLRPADTATTRWASERARGAATALRRLKRQVAAPGDGTWDRLAAVLRTEVVALACGDLGKLRWAPPPDPGLLRRSQWKTALVVLRTFALAVAPLVAVVALEPLLHLDAGALRWAKVIGLGWAVLYLLLAADPSLREKIETAQSVGNLLSTSRREPLGPERRDPEGADARR